GEFNLIQTTGKGATRGFSSIIINHIPNFDMMNKGQGYMLEYTAQNNGLELQLDNYNLNETFSTKVGLSREDTFYYVYGILHSKDYINRYYDNLTKEVPRIPQLSNKEKFVQVGKRLALLHLNYEDVPAYDSLDIQKKNQPSYKVAKMKFDKIRNHEGRLINNKSSIIYNGDITINNIPEKAYEYVVNGRSAIEWIMDQYQVKTDRKSGITDDPNLYSDDEKYIFKLLLSIINLSVKTVDLVNSLPPLEIIEE